MFWREIKVILIKDLFKNFNRNIFNDKNKIMRIF